MNKDKNCNCGENEDCLSCRRCSCGNCGCKGGTYCKKKTIIKSTNIKQKTTD